VLDLGRNLSRELLEETGIEIGTLEAEPGWTFVRDRGFLALLKRLKASEGVEELRSRAMRHLTSEAQPEFSDIRIVRGPEDFDPAMPPFVVAYLEKVWR
jgi:hypothetical protein